MYNLLMDVLRRVLPTQVDEQRILSSKIFDFILSGWGELLNYITILIFPITHTEITYLIQNELIITNDVC